MIKIRDLVVILGDFKLEIPSLDIRDQEYLVVMGPSGVGKTVFLYTLAGFIKPIKGRILVNDVDITDTEPEERCFPIIPEEYCLFPHMTVYENIAFGLKFRGVNYDKANDKVREIANILEINNLLNRYPESLSAGEKQRVAIARALVVNPNVILLDEPLRNLDPRLHSKAREFLKNLHKKLRFTAIHVTHDIVEAITLGDRIAYMEKGKLLGVYEPHKFIESQYGKLYIEALKPVIKYLG